MQFSPRNSPGPTKVIVASFPSAEVTVTLSRPVCTKKIASAESPCANAVSFFFRLRIFLPTPTLARKALASKTASPFVGLVLGVWSREGVTISLIAAFADRAELSDCIRLAGGALLRVGMLLVLVAYLRRAALPWVHCSSSRTRRRRFLPIQHEQGQRGLPRIDKQRARSRVAQRFPNIPLLLKVKTARAYAAAHAGGKLQSPIGRAADQGAQSSSWFCRPGRVRSISD